MEDPKEIWRKIEHHTSYSVSNLGRVRRDVLPSGRSIRRILRPSVGGHGYAHVVLSEHSKLETWKVHILVAEAFLGARPKGIEVNHKNFNRMDSRVDNLEYVSHRENLEHAWKAGRKPWLKVGEWFPSMIKEWWKDFTPEERKMIVKMQMCKMPIIFPLPTEPTQEMKAILLAHSKNANKAQEGVERFWITNGISNKLIPSKENKNGIIPDGWIKGRIFNPNIYRKDRQQ